MNYKILRKYKFRVSTEQGSFPAEIVTDTDKDTAFTEIRRRYPDKTTRVMFLGAEIVKMTPEGNN